MFEGDFTHYVELTSGLKQEGAVVPCYQPILDREQRRVGVEALARYRRHDRYDSIPFERLDADTVLAIDITMLHAIIDDLPRLASHNVQVLSINLTPDRTSPVYRNLLRLILVRARKVAITIWFEVLEVAPLHSHQLQFIATLRSHGARIVLDDFGTEACNFQRMLVQPYDVIKLDRSLLLQACDDQHATEMLRGLVDYLHRLDMEVVCEGIESAHHGALCEYIGCDYAQGFAYGRPSPLEQWHSA